MMTTLVVATSCSIVGDDHDLDGSTGVSATQLGMVHRSLVEAGLEMTLASPSGGPVPVHSGSLSEEWSGARDIAATGVGLPDLDRDFEAYVLLGGAGVLVDLRTDERLVRMLDRALSAGRTVVAIDQGAAALAQVVGPDGIPRIAGLRMTGRSSAEDRALGHHCIGIDSTEHRLRAAGAHYSAGPNWLSHVMSDAGVITAQNTASVPHAMSLLIDTRERLAAA